MCFVFTVNWTFCCPVLGSWHCTCTYTETVDLACRPSIPQIRQGSIRFNLKEEEPPPSSFPFLLYTVLILCSWLCNWFVSISRRSNRFRGGQYQSGKPACVQCTIVHCTLHTRTLCHCCQIGKNSDILLKCSGNKKKIAEKVDGGLVIKITFSNFGR